MGVAYNSTFPADPPVDHDLPTSVAEHDQRAFDQLEQVLSHWDRPRSRSYHWLISLDQHTGVVDLSQQCQQMLPKTGLSHIAPASMHLTVRRVGAVESVSHDDLEGSVSAMYQYCRTAGPFRLQVIPLAGSPGAVRFSVAPWSPLLDLWRAAVPGAGDPAPLQHYRPHIGIAYSNRVQPAKPLVAAVQQARALPPVETAIGEVQLVELYRADHQYCWHTIERVPLGKDDTSEGPRGSPRCTGPESRREHAVQADEFDEKFDRGEDITSELDVAKEQRPGEEHRRSNVDFPRG